MKKSRILLISLIFVFVSCTKMKLYLGADLSYVNEVEDCGAVYTKDGSPVDPFELFKDYGANIVRVRLWHSPEWTAYSNLNDVIKTIKRAKEQKMEVLLDFHYSDTWADPQKQIIPKAWSEIKDLKILEDSMYYYTYNVLHKLNNLGLMPEMVQVGNEINIEILQHGEAKKGDTINWHRNIALINQGIKAVRDAASESKTKSKVMIHIAQPENALKWFPLAIKNGIADFDLIGLSYYSKWSKYSMNQLDQAIQTLHETYQKDVLVVETSYPWTLENFDNANNVLGQDALVEPYEPTPEGQYKYMVDLTKAVVKGSGIGVIYWEPAWISSACKTLWGTGSHWENATFFDAGNNNSPLPAMQFYSQDYK
ncbi:MAG: glycosyl hydrolase 53 family protein [Bacteroidales bacterium]|nr:glycosyl hydrolase 53 family protein [Bacteroidales bacterium]